MKGQNLIDEHSIDYKSLIANELFSEYIQLAHQLKQLNLDDLIEENDENQTDLNITSFFISKQNMFGHLFKQCLKKKNNINI